MESSFQMYSPVLVRVDVFQFLPEKYYETSDERKRNTCDSVGNPEEKISAQYLRVMLEEKNF